ncbi:MAG: ATP-binding protein [Marinilabiliaceae bacterium]|nr:ATP-binding protein [Marinilabiliaceae bacterium]
MKIAVCGTYSSGKTTTSIALSYLTGIETTHALTMREILPNLFPGKKLENCTPEEVLELIFQRMIYRVANEAKCRNSFISDGASIQEWAYCKPRLLYGMNPAETEIQDTEILSNLETFGKTIDAYGKMAKNYAKKHYDVFVHLPIEFPNVLDGHRPVSESFRKCCDKLLRQAYSEIGLPFIEVRGDLVQRLTEITQKLEIKCAMDVHQAITIAKKEVKERFDNIKLETN